MEKAVSYRNGKLGEVSSPPPLRCTLLYIWKNKYKFAKKNKMQQ